MFKKIFSIVLFLVLAQYGITYMRTSEFVPKVKFTKHDLRTRLTPMQYRITQTGYPEYSWSGVLVNFFDEGKYNCVACNELLFTSEDKYQPQQSTIGYPTFHTASGKVAELSDKKDYNSKYFWWGLVTNQNYDARVLCENCGANVGTVHDNEPKSPTKREYIINQYAINFERSTQEI